MRKLFFALALSTFATTALAQTAPVSGEVVARNEALDTDSALINSDPYGEGWLLEIKLAEADAVESLLSASEYEQQVG